MTRLYHNPRCSKSRATLALLEEKQIDFETITYLDMAPTTQELKNIIAMLGITSARDMMRTGESIYKDLGLKDITDENILIDAMANHPILIERPIVVNDGKARIGRPPENVLEIL